MRHARPTMQGESGNWRCTICGKVRNTRSSVLRHIKVNHPKVRTDPKRRRLVA